MRILVSSYPFYPSVGGLEEVTDLLAHEFVARGHSVKIVTMTPSSAPDDLPFDVIRRPSARELIRAVGWCDVYLQQNISLQLGWPLVLVRRPWVIAHHAPFGDRGGFAGFKRRLKAAIARLAQEHIACSRGMARSVGEAIPVITNPYREALFRSHGDEGRSRDLVFLGRLVSDKGAFLVLEAMAKLRDRGLMPSLVIIGGGPEQAPLKALCTGLALGSQVEFSGVVRGVALVELLNQCRIMVIPSIWEEPFGVVALEGIACGCVVVAARTGGLPEAIGPCGVTFETGNAASLADCLTVLLRDQSKIRTLRSQAPLHLARHRPTEVADAYLRVLERARRQPRSERLA
jgi:glycogen synthase